jgi:glycosyltransferase involved in cell wall biosynthesis
MTAAPPQTDLNLSIIVPAYNEQASIGFVLETLSTLMQQSGMMYEIIVVDDGSHDGTAQIVEAHTEIVLVRHKVNRGYGAALKTGIQHAQHNLICITDADGTYPNERIPELAAALVDGRYDMVVGARIGANVNIPALRRPAKWVIGRLATLVAAEPIADVNSGLRVFKRAVAVRFFNLLPEGFSFTTTITLAMLSNGYRVDYIPIDYKVRIGKSKIRPIRDTLNFVQLILRVGLYFAPLKIFMPISLFLILLSMAWGVFSALVLGRLADVSTLILMMTGLQIAVLGLLAELINRRLPNYYREE